jgi:hypothetical protein
MKHGPNADSSLRRALAALAPKRSLTAPAFKQLILSLVETKEQATNLMSDLQRNGYTERRVRITQKTRDATNTK